MTGGEIDALLRRALDCGASDLHLDVGAQPTVRLDGHLARLDVPPLTPDDTAAVLSHLAQPRLIGRLDERGELDCSYSLPGAGRLRVHAFRQRGSIGLALRVIPAEVPSWRELGLPASVAELARRPAGLLLVTGRTGSGKSTTLAALVDLLNRERQLHIVTLEDPIEYLHRHRESIVNQREIGVDAPAFAPALRAALRQDPDAILAGELPDAETIAIALSAAETGHLVLAALPTADAVQAMTRLCDAFAPGQQPHVRLQLAATLLGVVSQELLPRCDRAGRVAAFEVLVATEAARNLIREDKAQQLPALIQTGARHGMQSRQAALRALLESGAISPEDYRARVPGG